MKLIYSSLRPALVPNVSYYQAVLTHSLSVFQMAARLIAQAMATAPEEGMALGVVDAVTVGRVRTVAQKEKRSVGMAKMEISG